MKDPTLAEVASFLDGMAAQIVRPIEAREAMQARARVVRKAESDLDYARLQTREAFAMIRNARNVQEQIEKVFRNGGKAKQGA